MIGETCPSFCSNRISASLRGRPSVPTTLPSTEDICAESVAVKTNELTRTRLAITTRLCRTYKPRQLLGVIIVEAVNPSARSPYSLGAGLKKVIENMRKYCRFPE